MGQTPRARPLPRSQNVSGSTFTIRTSRVPLSAISARPLQNIHPDPQAKTLTITLHSLATPKNNAAIAYLCTELNASQTHYPGTDLLMIFKSVSS